MKENQLYGARHDDHDWDKIANVDVRPVLLVTYRHFLLLTREQVTSVCKSFWIIRILQFHQK